jgi:hypothetical protein
MVICGLTNLARYANGAPLAAVWAPAARCAQNIANSSDRPLFPARMPGFTMDGRAGNRRVEVVKP